MLYVKGIDNFFIFSPSLNSSVRYHNKKKLSHNSNTLTPPHKRRENRKLHVMRKMMENLYRKRAENANWGEKEEKERRVWSEILDLITKAKKFDIFPLPCCVFVMYCRWYYILDSLLLLFISQSLLGFYFLLISPFFCYLNKGERLLLCAF